MRSHSVFFTVAAGLVLFACEDVIEPGPVHPGPLPVITILPERGAPPHAYCKRRDDAGRQLLSVEFRNIGGAAYGGGATISVDFGSHGTRTVAMKPIAAGATESHDVEIPLGCFRPDCGFAISWSNQPPVQGMCLG